MYKYIKQLFTLAGIVSLLFVFACDNMGGDQSKGKSKGPSYTKVFANTLIKHAENDTKIVGITGAMPSGTGLDLFEKKFPL